MKVCKKCQSLSFDDMETCYGCLEPFDKQPAAVEVMPVKVTSTTLEPLSFLSDITTEREHSEAIAVTERQQSNTSGIARLQVRMPDGYYYDIYLEKPKGASIQIGWVPDALLPTEEKTL